MIYCSDVVDGEVRPGGSHLVMVLWTEKQGKERVRSSGCHFMLIWRTDR